MRLKDKVAIVTGGAHGMGEAEARLFASEGAKVVVADILGNEAEAVAAHIRAGGGEAIAATIDVTSEPAWVELIAKTLASYGRLDVLVNNAGISGSSVGDPDGLEGWHRIIAVNQTSVFVGTKLAAEQMAKTGGGALWPLYPLRTISECRIDAGLPHIGRFEHVRGRPANQGSIGFSYLTIAGRTFGNRPFDAMLTQRKEATAARAAPRQSDRGRRE